MEALRVFIGYDSREPVAFHVAAHSILTRASCPVQIIPLVQSTLRTAGVYTRERGSVESTEFSMTRFLVPYLCDYKGKALFMDCDMICLADIAELFELTAHHEQAVWVCPHEYTPKAGLKMDGQLQTAYPRKNWSSVMVFDNTRCTQLTPEYVNTATGLQLHRFQWMNDEELGFLPLEWNWLVGEYALNPEAKMLHYTLGGPWFPAYRDCDYADVWHAEYASMTPGVTDCCSSGCRCQ